MRMKVDYKGLRFKLWVYFGLFTASIMGLLWLLQIVFLKTYYTTMKANEIKRIGNAIVEYYGEKNFNDLLFRFAFNNGMSVRIFSKSGQSIVLSHSNYDVALPNAFPDDNSDLVKEIDKSKTGKVFHIKSDERLNGQMLVYGAVLSNAKGGKLYLAINAQIAPIDATTSVLESLLGIVIVISSLMAFVLSYFISLKISKPITKITLTAETLAKGNYDVIFEGGNYTEINKLASTLNYATRELSRTDELRKDLIANVSHDLRTPLTMIKMYGEMIRDISGNNPEKRNAHTKVIIDETDRLTGLVNDILDLSKLQSGTDDINPVEFDLTEKTMEILSRFNVMTERNGYVFNIKCDENAIVFADEKKVEQVIYNLVSNAVNYTGDDKIVTIRVKNTNRAVRFEVTDTGKGIPEEKIKHIWERYYKAKETHKRAVIGTGLGLSIVKGILTSHDAEFGVNSAVGKGSTFWFELKKPSNGRMRQLRNAMKGKGKEV